MKYVPDSEKTKDGSVPQRKTLQVYVLFDSKSVFKNLASSSGEENIPEKDSKSLRFADGPFGGNENALAGGNFYVNDFASYDSVPPNYLEFTMSFYWKSSIYSDQFRIIQLSFEREGRLFDYLNITSHGYDLIISMDKLTTPKRIGNMLSQSSFKFVAIQYSAYNRILNVIDEKGQTSSSYSIISENLASSTVKPTFLRTRVNLGFGSSSAISCLSVHSSLLSPAEIRQLPCSCQFKTQANSAGKEFSFQTTFLFSLLSCFYLNPFDSFLYR